MLIANSQFHLKTRTLTAVKNEKEPKILKCGSNKRLKNE